MNLVIFAHNIASLILVRGFKDLNIKISAKYKVNFKGTFSKCEIYVIEFLYQSLMQLTASKLMQK